MASTSLSHTAVVVSGRATTPAPAVRAYPMIKRTTSGVDTCHSPSPSKSPPVLLQPFHQKVKGQKERMRARCSFSKNVAVYPEIPYKTRTDSKFPKTSECFCSLEVGVHRSWRRSLFFRYNFHPIPTQPPPAHLCPLGRSRGCSARAGSRGSTPASPPPPSVCEGAWQRSQPCAQRQDSLPTPAAPHPPLPAACQRDSSQVHLRGSEMLQY